MNALDSKLVRQRITLLASWRMKIPPSTTTVQSRPANWRLVEMQVSFTSVPRSTLVR